LLYRGEMTGQIRHQISNIKLSAQDNNISYYFAETDDVTNLRNAERRRDLPAGNLTSGKDFEFKRSASALNPNNSICIVARDSKGGLLGAACDANGVILHTPPGAANVIPPSERKHKSLGSKVRTLNDLPKVSNEVQVRHVFDEPQRKSNLILMLGYLIIIIIVSLCIYHISKKSNPD